MAYLKGRRRANQVVIHLDNDELKKLNAYTETYGYCREEFIRDAIEHFGQYVNEDVKVCNVATSDSKEVFV